MGRRGPKPTPTPILKMRGSWRAKLNPAEPKPEAKAPPRPDALSEAATAIWKRIVPQLERMGVLGQIDGERIARYCELAALWWKAKEFVDKYGAERAVKTDSGVEIVEYPALSRMIRLDDRLARTEASFGMEPSSRSRLVVEASQAKAIKDDNPKAAYFGKGG